jgi:hypothetical protein
MREKEKYEKEEKGDDKQWRKIKDGKGEGGEITEV